MKVKQIFLLIFIEFSGIECEFNIKIPKVEYKNGWVVGRTFKTTNSKEFEGFLGIPFAKPPIGDLRLRVSKSEIFAI